MEQLHLNSYITPNHTARTFYLHTNPERISARHTKTGASSPGDTCLIHESYYFKTHSLSETNHSDNYLQLSYIMPRKSQ